MRSWIFAALLLIPSARLAAQNIGINANGASPNTSAMLDIDVSAIPGTKRGLLIPRMTTVERNAIVTPATSLLVFNTTTNQFEYFDGAIWRALLSSAAAGWTLTGNTIAATDFIGTLNNQPLAFRVNNQPAGRLEFASLNSFFGTNTGVGNTGTANTFIGGQAGVANTAGSANTYLGAGAGVAASVGSENTAIGFQSSVSNGLTNATAIGAYAQATQPNSLVLGSIAGVNAAPASTNVGIGTTAPTERLDVVGKARVTNFQMTTGAGAGMIMIADALGNGSWANPAGNTVNAWDLTGNSGTNPSVNYIGTSDNALLRFRTNNTQAGLLDHATLNAFYGTNAGIVSGGSLNTFLGATAGNANSTGAGNTFVGAASGGSNSTGTENTAIGFSANVSNALTNATAVGNRALATQSNSVVLGSINGVNGSSVSANVGIGTTAPAQRLHVVGNIRMEDGNQAVGRVLTSDVNGVASWQAPAGSGWGLVGNAGTNPATNFVGTTDAQALVFRTGNLERARISAAGNFGVNTTAPGNSLHVRFAPLGPNINATMRLEVAEAASSTNVTFSNSVNGNNVSFGLAGNGDFGLALAANFSSAAGDALRIKPNGNVGMGTLNALDRLHVVGSIRMVDGNQAIGRVMVSNANGTATWTDPLTVASGLAWTLTGNAGTNPATNFIGTTDAQALRFRTANQFAGNLPVVASQFVSYGLLAGPNNVGTGNTFVGNSAGLANITGGSNTFLGNNAGAANVTSANNTYVGTSAGAANVNGQQNVYIGRLAGGNGTTGSDNILIGNGAGIGNTANNNVMIGSFAGNGNSTGGGNTFLGTQSGAATSTGGQNTFIGTSAGSTNATGTQNTLVGNGAAVNANNLTNATAIGRASRVDVNNGLVLGSVNGINGSTSTSLVGIGTTAPVERLHVVGNIRMVDGNQAANRVMVSDANGTASWQTLGAAATNAWGLLGNAGTNPATNFVGTTDAQPLRFRTGNAFSGQVGNTATALVSYGLSAGAAVTTLAARVTAIGASAGAANTDGDDNTYVGANAGAAMTTSFFSTYVGSSAGRFASASNNALFGYLAGGLGVMTGGLNTFLGSQSGSQNTAGNGNTFVGFSAGSSTTSGSQNVFIGREAGSAALTVSASVFVGSFAGNVTTVSGNTFVGGNAGRLNTTGNNNAFLGDQAGTSNVVGSDNTFLGHNSGSVNTASDNTFVGSRSGDSNTTGAQNTYMGTNAGTANVAGNDGTFIGFGTGLANTGSGSTFVGSGAGDVNSTGTDNTFIGQDAGNTNTTGSNNVVLGNNADVAAAALTNAIAIGADAIAGASNSLVLGATGASAVNVGIGMTTPLTTVDMLGALSIRDDGTVTSVAADNQLITVGDRGYIRLSSTSATSTARTITLSDGLVRGQLLLLECVTTGAFEVDDNAATNNTNASAARPLGVGDTIMLVWNGTDWAELNYSNN
ncbi:MAG: hypothetical protein IPG10_09295 [Flavobacteriales bacterium]|nr:hypothetical protein [Flavobacteriales bacterium]